MVVSRRKIAFSNPIRSRIILGATTSPIMKTNAPDVRMFGFRSRSSVQDAWNWLDSVIDSKPREGVETPLKQAYSRVLADDVVAPIDVPGFDRSAMDGYAVIADETTGADSYTPISFTVIGEAFPGRGFAGTMQPQQAVRIMTGAPIPKGATAVVPVEYTEQSGDSIRVTSPIGSGKHISRTGEDVRKGTVVLHVGRRLRPQDVAVIASLGVATVSTIRQPTVRLLITGDEFAHVGESKQPQQIYEANSWMLRGLIPRDGGVLESVQFVGDSESDIEHALRAPQVDVILVSGGSSVGAADHAPQVVARLGELPIHGLSMRPSSPAGLGRIGQTIVALLPGNPVSCLCAYDFFAGRAIRQLAGLGTDWPYASRKCRLSKKIVSDIGRTDYCRVSVEDDVATPLAISGASILSSTTRACGFVVVPTESEGLPAGEELQVWLYG